METESTTPSLPVQTLQYPWMIFTQNLIENISSGAVMLMVLMVPDWVLFQFEYNDRLWRFVFKTMAECDGGSGDLNIPCQTVATLIVILTNLPQHPLSI